MNPENDCLVPSHRQPWKGARTLFTRQMVGSWWELLSKLFVKLTTLVPSSSAVERFFSQGKNILKAKRAFLADKTFEMSMFMRGNKLHFWC